MIFRFIEVLRGWLLPAPFWLRDRGAKGEFLTRRWFHRRGYHLVAKNWRCGRGEIDLILADHRRLVFVEVKSRQLGQANLGNVLGREQEHRLLRLARAFLAQYPDQRISWSFKLALVEFAGARHRIRMADV